MKKYKELLLSITLSFLLSCAAEMMRLDVTGFKAAANVVHIADIESLEDDFVFFGANRGIFQEFLNNVNSVLPFSCGGDFFLVENISGFGFLTDNRSRIFADMGSHFFGSKFK